MKEAAGTLHLRPLFWLLVLVIQKLNIEKATPAGAACEYNCLKISLAGYQPGGDSAIYSANNLC